MINFTEGNLLKSHSEALVNTVNEVGVMGKGIALMFREAFPGNTREYELASKRGEIRVGKMFVTATDLRTGPKWIINFPTKKHWRNPSKIEWIRDGLADLARVIMSLRIKSIAIPPLGCGNGGLDWSEVKPLIIEKLGALNDVHVEVFVPTRKYQNDPKVAGVNKLTPAKALLLEMIKRYSILGFECSLLEVQKLAWFLERGLKFVHLDDPLKLKFVPGPYGPYADSLRHVLNSLDGSYLRSDKRIADSNRYSVVALNWEKRSELDSYLEQPRMKKYWPAIEWTQNLIEGFESPFGMELLATVDWLLTEKHAVANIESLRVGLQSWPHEKKAVAERKNSIFDDRVLEIALTQILSAQDAEGAQRQLAL